MDLKLFLIGTFLLIVTIICQTAAEEEKKKLKLVLDKLEKINDAEHILKTDLTFDRDDDDNEVKINGQVVQSVDLDEEYKLNMNILHSSEKDGEYKKVIGVTNLDVCNVMKTQYKKYFYDTLKNYSNAPDPDTCPVTKETYVVKNYPLDSSKFQKFLRPGFYIVESYLMHEDKEVLQYTVEAHTEEE